MADEGSRPLSAGEWICGLGAALCFVGLALAIVSGYLPLVGATQYGWDALVADRLDDQAYVSARVLSGEAGNAGIVVFGDSSAREGLWSDAALGEYLGRPPAGQRIVNLASSAQTAAEALVLAHAMKLRAGQTLIVFLRYSSLRQSDPFLRLEQGSFLFPPTAILGDTRAHPASWLRPWASISLSFQAVRQNLQRQLRYRLKYWVQERLYGISRAAYQPYHPEYASTQGPAERARQAASITADLKWNFKANLSYQLAALDQLAQLVHERQARLIIAASPGSGPISVETQQEREIFHRELDQFVQRRGVEWLDLNARLSWQEDDFSDLTHVTPVGREKWSRAFGDWVRSQPNLLGR